MVFEGLVGLGVAILLGAGLAEYSKFRQKAEKGWNWLALSGVWFLFAGSFSVATTLSNPAYVGALWFGLGSAFEIIGWLAALIGAVFVAYETILER